MHAFRHLLKQAFYCSRRKADTGGDRFEEQTWRVVQTQKSVQITDFIVHATHCPVVGCNQVLFLVARRVTMNPEVLLLFLNTKVRVPDPSLVPPNERKQHHELILLQPALLRSCFCDVLESGYYFFYICHMVNKIREEKMLQTVIEESFMKHINSTLMTPRGI